MEKPFVRLHQIIVEFHLNLFYAPVGCLESHVTSMDVYRPGLQLVGFYDHFDAGSIQVLGKVEWAFLQGLDSHQRERVFELLFEKKIPLLIFARDYEPFPECLAMAEKYGVPVAGSGEYTTDLMAAMSMSVPGAFVPARSLELSKAFPWNMCETSNPLLWQRVFDFPFFVIHKKPARFFGQAFSFTS